MSAADLIKQLIKLGVSIKDIASKSKNNGGVDWTKVLQTAVADQTSVRRWQAWLRP